MLHQISPREEKKKKKIQSLNQAHIITIVPFRVFSQATNVNMIPPVSQQTHGHGKKESRQEREKTKNTLEKEKKKDNNKYSGRCCEDMRAKGGEKKKKTPTATVQEVFLEQGAVRAVWILSAMTVRGAAGCSASAFVRPLALQNVAS